MDFLINIYFMLCGSCRYRMLDHGAPCENVCRTVFNELALLDTPRHKAGWVQKQSIIRQK